MQLSTVVTLLVSSGLASGLQLLPPTRGEVVSNLASWNVASGSKTIYIEEGIAATSDTDGLTLIPPTGYEFADLFREDISQITGDEWTLERVETLPRNSSGIFLGSFTGDSSSLTYENGQATSEGYELDVSANGAFIGGTGARGMWWGTRTLLQHILISSSNGIPSGRYVDAPAYATRGFMLDAGRKWYKPELLKELCSFASFFKMSEFHYHLSDNYPLNRGHNESWQDVYSHFSLLPEDESLLGILHGRENETLSREDYADFQSHCAARGVTVIPEIEAPGHCLYVTKWKPELSLEKRDLLNLSHPETVPTIKRIWAEFLPWFETKEVHVGADEYDRIYADDYINFVNEMSTWVNETSGKRVRIWGTPMDEPVENITISTDIVVQHWQYGQSDPIVLIEDGHDIVNSQDWWAYMSIKNDHDPIFPARYPQFFNESRVLNFAHESGWQWGPADFNQVNTSLQVADDEVKNKGAIMAAWNDNGPDASTQLEAYYAMRRGIALVGARAWSGSRGPELVAEDVAPTIDWFSPLAPGQNLDRVLPAPRNATGPLLTWSRSSDGDEVELGSGSKGLNYTMKLTVNGPFALSGPDNTLTLGEDGSLVFEADGYVYPLREVTEQDAMQLDPGHPGRIWANLSSSTHEPVTIPVPRGSMTITISTDAEHGSVAWVNERFAGRFEVFVFGGRNTRFSWSQMAFVAPLDKVTGTGLQALTSSVVGGSYSTWKDQVT
ncbi:family 20 glycosyl hydrolase [Stachybotrys elegans]|uniref:beta-N-acetylhexosaminidase n=1 Tax=Stachybotrys elegans TaxID=80388 RepID=A0A8K0SYB6_9HYPO|nr:family 20 glycosyl hydrolase [Stachybotrys elegans]